MSDFAAKLIHVCPLINIFLYIEPGFFLTYEEISDLVFTRTGCWDAVYPCWWKGFGEYIYQ